MSADFVLGFIFDGPNFVYLIRKSSPKEQAGDLNGVGGRVEDGEDPAAAMKRHGLAEVGYAGDWTEYARMEGEGWSCAVYLSVVSGPPPVAVKEDLAGEIPIEDLCRLPSSMRLVRDVYTLVHAGADHVRDARASFLTLNVREASGKRQEPEEGKA